MPKMIDEREDFELENPEDNRRSTAQFLAKQPQMLQVGQWPLLKAGHTIRFIENGETLYHVKLVLKRKGFWHSPKQIVQVEVWRQVGAGDRVHGLPKAVFFGYLLQHYGAIVSDYLHTDSGKRFWLDRCAEAMNYGYHVYFGDYASRSLEEVHNRSELLALYDRCWGYDKKHEYRRMAILSRQNLINEKL